MTPPSRPGPAALARLGAFLTDLCERYFPDAFVFALAGVLLVFVAGLALGESPARLVTEFGGGFWVLVPFTMQMALVIIGGFVVASSPPVARLISGLAAIPKTARGAVAFTAFFAMATSLLSWGLSLIFTGLLVRELTRRVDGLDYRAVSAAAYLVDYDLTPVGFRFVGRLWRLEQEPLLRWIRLPPPAKTAIRGACSPASSGV